MLFEMAIAMVSARMGWFGRESVDENVSKRQALVRRQGARGGCVKKLAALCLRWEGWVTVCFCQGHSF